MIYIWTGYLDKYIWYKLLTRDKLLVNNLDKGLNSQHRPKFQAFDPICIYIL